LEADTVRLMEKPVVLEPQSRVFRGLHGPEDGRKHWSVFLILRIAKLYLDTGEESMVCGGFCNERQNKVGEVHRRKASHFVVWILPKQFLSHEICSGLVAR
jgi:hypothetical protein